MQRYAVQHRAGWMDAAESIAIPASHQDQVVTCPPDAKVILASDFTPFAGLDYGDAISFQGHPEFSNAFGIALIEQRRDRYGALADPAIASYAEPDDRARLAGWIGRFLAYRPAERAK
jgi:GMP synthase-like glutamine amidotransferase